MVLRPIDNEAHQSNIDEPMTAAASVVKRRRIIFLNRFFFPDYSATSQMLTDLAFHLADAGRKVDVVTSQQKYDEPKVRLPDRETARGVHIHRVATTHFGRSTLLGRGIDYLSFYSAMWRTVLALIRPGDVLIA